MKKNKILIQSNQKNKKSQKNKEANTKRKKNKEIIYIFISFRKWWTRKLKNKKDRRQRRIQTPLKKE